MYPHKRRFDTRNQKRLFVVSVEGAVTEVEYLERLGRIYYACSIIEILRNVNNSSPFSVLDRIKNCRCSLKRGDELWCVVDKDKWTDEQLDAVAEWSQVPGGGISRNFGLSNPKIELWLLLHFVDWKPGDAIIPTLLREMPEYSKHLDETKITVQKVMEAIERAKALTPDGLPPRAAQGTNLWVLAEHIGRQTL